MIRWKVLDFTTDEVSGVLSMLEALSGIQSGTRRSDSHVRAL
jgi:hypothetical protein